jgi:hypothetical protein
MKPKSKMDQYMSFDDQDKAALRALADFTISVDSETAIETATIVGKMKIQIILPGR